MTTESDQGVGFSLVHPDEEAKSNASSAMTVVIHQRNEAKRRVAELEAWQQVARENYEDLRLKCEQSEKRAEELQVKHDARLALLATADAGLAEAWAETAQSRQMLADAPHDRQRCAYSDKRGDSVCTCWKAGL